MSTPDRAEAWHRARAVAIVGVLLVTGCRSGSERPGSPSTEAPPTTWDAGASADVVAEVAANRCGPTGRDRLYTDARTRDPATAARWYADRTEPKWQQLAEEACYLALVSAEP